MSEADTASGTLVGFVGLGDMGLPMALRLVEAGHEVLAFDLRAAALEEAAGGGAQTASGLDDIAARCPVVAVCVLDDAQLLRVAGPGSPLLEEGAVRTIVVHSTVRPETVRAVGEAASARGVSVVDAPVSGNQEARRSGRLTIMVGGTADAIASVRPLLAACGEPVLELGDVGAGQVGKLANQIMSLTNFLGVLDAVRLAASYGMTQETVQRIGETASGGSWSLRNLAFFDELFRQHTTAAGEDLFEFLRKDLWLAVDAAADAGVRLELASVAAIAAQSVYRRRKADLDRAGGSA